MHDEVYQLTEQDRKKVKELHDRTGLPSFVCRAALIEARGDFQKAYDLLRQRNPMPGLD